jgi:hypothetical protein
MKEIKYGNKDYTIRGVASSYEHGYEVYYTDEDDRKRSVQFRIFLNSAMKLVAIANSTSPGVSISDIVAARAIADAELESSPSVFHVVGNGFYDRQRLRRAADQSKSLRGLDDSDPHLVATEARIGQLDKIVTDARKWSGDPDRRPWKEFMDGQVIEANKRDFDVEEKLDVGDEFRSIRRSGRSSCTVR